MSTNKTPNYQLHSWLPQDEFHLTEINENFAALDAALKAEAQAAVQGRAALQSAVAEKTRGTTGIYIGDGQTGWRSIELGFRPAAVIVEQPSCARLQNVFLGGMAVAQHATVISITDTGFQVNQSTYNQLNNIGVTYLFLVLG